MPWENKGGDGGGPWGGGDGGSVGKDGGGGPWGGGSGCGSGGGSGGGGGPWGGGGGGGGRRPPDIEEMIRKGQDRFKRALPSGRGLGPIGISVALLVILAIWIVSGFYRVQNNQQGVELVFGKHVITTDPGLHWNYPFPVGSVSDGNEIVAGGNFSRMAIWKYSPIDDEYHLEFLSEDLGGFTDFVDAGDIDGDGDLEIVVDGNFTSSLFVFDFIAGSWQIRYAVEGRGILGMALADFDGDGRDEVIVGTGGITVFEIDDAGVFRETFNFGYGSYVEIH